MKQKNMSRYKKYYFLLFFVIACSACYGQINFITNGNLRTVFDLAKAQHKKVFLEVYASDCHTCMAFEPTFKNAEVSKYYNDHFISYRLEANKMETLAFVQKQKLNIVSTPTFLFYNADVKIIYQVALKDDQNTAQMLIQEATKAVAK